MTELLLCVGISQITIKACPNARVTVHLLVNNTTKSSMVDPVITVVVILGIAGMNYVAKQKARIREKSQLAGDILTLQRLSSDELQDSNHSAGCL